MRTKEQFKAYVYEKAEEKKHKNRRTRNIWLRGVATCSLLIIIGIVMLYGNLDVNNVANECAPDMAAAAVEEECEIEVYSNSVLEDGALDKTESAVAGKTTQNYQYSSTYVDDYAQYGSQPDKEYSEVTLDRITNGFLLEIFDYGEVLKNTSRGGGVKTESFNNTSKVTDEDFDVVELAKNECTVEYDKYSVALDDYNGIWRVTFYMSDTAGGSQEVYIDSDGITRLIVYGE